MGKGKGMAWPMSVIDLREVSTLPPSPELPADLDLRGLVELRFQELNDKIVAMDFKLTELANLHRQFLDQAMRISQQNNQTSQRLNHVSARLTLAGVDDP